MIAHTNYGRYHASTVHSLSLMYYWYLKLKKVCGFLSLKKDGKFIFGVTFLAAFKRTESVASQ